MFYLNKSIEELKKYGFEENQSMKNVFNQIYTSKETQMKPYYPHYTIKLLDNNCIRFDTYGHGISDNPDLMLFTNTLYDLFKDNVIIRK